MPVERDTRLALLNTAYDHAKGKSVAFIDESYVLADIAAGGATFYIATAYVAPQESHEAIRSDLVAIAGNTYWHTSESHQDESQRPVIVDMCKYIGEGDDSESIVLAIKRPIADDDNGGETARRECIIGLLSALAAGAHTAPVPLAVLEERKFMKQRNIDEATIKIARRSGLLGRMQVMFTTPSIEPLLWVPDVASFAQNHHERRSGFTYASYYAHKVVTIEIADPR